MLNTVCLTEKDDALRKQDYARWLKHCETMNVDWPTPPNEFLLAIYSAGWTAAYARGEWHKRQGDTIVVLLLLTWSLMMIVVTGLGIWALCRYLFY